MLQLFTTACATVFALCAVGEALLLNAESDANKAQPHAFLCFDKAGHVTEPHGWDWSECRPVAIRELSRD